MSEEPSSDPTRSQVWQLVKILAQFVGVLGGSAGGFAALSFGIGYLSIKSHNAMLGVPTVSADAEAYVRAGAMFFPQTLQFIVDSLTRLFLAVIGLIPTLLGHLIGPAGIVALVIVGLGWVSWRRFPALRDRVRSVRAGETNRRPKPEALRLALIAVALFYLPLHVAPMHAGNRDLLFPTDMLSAPPEDTFARQIHDSLREEDGEDTLHAFYGAQVAMVLVLFGGALAVGLLEFRSESGAPDAGSASGATQPATSGRGGIRFSFSVSSVFLYLLLIATTVTLPANYGVLGMSTRYPCVRMELKEATEGERERAGFLLSDLSTSTSTAVVLQRAGGHYVHRFYDRGDIGHMTVASCGNKNILAGVD